MRLAAPAHLVDINGSAELADVEVDRRRGAGRRAGPARARLERDDGAYAALPLLRQALRHVAHPTIRNRGTTVGSIAHADPAGEMPAVLLLLRRRGRAGQRRAGPARSPRPTSSSARWSRRCARTSWPWRRTFPARRPAPAPRSLEVARRHGDYAMCGRRPPSVTADDGAVASARAALRLGRPDPGAGRPDRRRRRAAPRRRRLGRGRRARPRPRSTPRPTSTPPPTTAGTWSRVLTAPGRPGGRPRPPRPARGGRA